MMARSAYSAVALAALVAAAAACTVEAKTPNPAVDAASGGADAANGGADAASGGADAASGGADAGDTGDCPRVRIQVSADSSLRIRAEPNTSSDVLGNIPPDAVVTVLDRVQGETILGDPEWFEIEYQSTVGFISGAYAECTTDPVSGFAPPPDTGNSVG